MKHTQLFIAIGAILVCSSASAGGLLGTLLGGPKMLHELQLAQAADQELYAQAHICKQLGGTPSEIKAKARADGGIARGMNCSAQAYSYTSRLEFAPMSEKEASLVVEVALNHEVDVHSIADLLGQRNDQAGYSQDACNTVIEPTAVSIKCSGSSVGAVVAQFRPNRFAPWTDVAKAQAAARRTAFGDQ